MPRMRVHELAKELGITSKELREYLQSKGEFVTSASSMVEAPIVRSVREHYENIQPEPEKTDTKTQEAKPAPKAKAKAKPKGSATKPKAKTTDKPGPKPGPKSAVQASAATPEENTAQSDPVQAEEPEASSKDVKAESVKQEQIASEKEQPSAKTAPKPTAVPKPPVPKPPSPRSGGDAKPSMPRPRGPRPGNNPYASTQGMPRPGGPRRGGTGPDRSRGRVEGKGRGPNPSMMPGSTSVGRPDTRPARGGQGGRGRPGAGARPAGRGPQTGPPPAAFSGPPRGGRGGGRGATPGAFGRGGGRSRKGRKSKRAKRQEFEQQEAPAIGGVSVPRGNGQEIRIRQGASLVDFAERIDVNPAALVTVLFHLGEMVTATQSLDQDTLEVLGDELGYVVKTVSPEDEDKELLEAFDIDLEAETLDDEENMVPRSPVVTVMGHVDHGKTRLLDAIRKTNVIEGEHGGITQHIGAYQIHVEDEDGEDRPITFLDTPGHEAFTAMRARGAQATDLAILVVAADDGVMPQTVEAINHAQSAGVPIVVAVNKVDKPEANPDKIRAQLTEYGLVAEEYGGDVMFVDVSAREGTGIDDLLEALLLTADAALELEANPDTLARGIAIEANLDRGRGAVTTMLVQRGTLRVGDAVVIGSSYGRVRAMFDEYGNELDQAPPARPVQMLGLTSVPRAGDTFLVAADDRTARQIADKREAVERQALLAKRRKRVTLEDFDKVLKEGEIDTLNLIIKGDVAGAVEALEDSLLDIEVDEEVALRIIHRGVGAITQNDVNLATVDNAVIIAFNVRPAERVQELADEEGIEIKYYSVIYQALEEIEEALKGMLKPIYEDVDAGSAEIKQVFRSGKFGNIAGSMVRKGTIKRGAKARLVRDGVVVAPDLEIKSLRREQDDVTEVREGFECGITLGYRDVAVGDIIETWEVVEKARD